MEWFRSLMLPPQGSEFAAEVDTLYMFLFWLCSVLFIGIAFAAIYFTVRYKYKPGRVTPHITAQHDARNRVERAAADALRGDLLLGLEQLDEVFGCSRRVDGNSDHCEEMDLDV